MVLVLFLDDRIVSLHLIRLLLSNPALIFGLMFRLICRELRAHFIHSLFHYRKLVFALLCQDV